MKTIDQSMTADRQSKTIESTQKIHFLAVPSPASASKVGSHAYMSLCTGYHDSLGALGIVPPDACLIHLLLKDWMTTDRTRAYPSCVHALYRRHGRCTVYLSTITVVTHIENLTHKVWATQNLKPTICKLIRTSSTRCSVISKEVDR